MATIKEIADLAGVSRGTVDRVLNKRGAVKPETADKIMEIARALDYKPNLAGIYLAAQKKKLKIGVVMFGVGNSFFDEVIQGVNSRIEELAGYNCSVIIKRVSSSVEDQLEAMEELEQEDISGLALSPYNDPRILAKINDLSERHIPVVTFNTDIEHSKRIAYVGSNYLHSGETAAGLMRLITSGRVYTGIITGSENVLCHTQRIAGFSQCIAKNYPHISIVDTIINNDDEFESYDLTLKLLTEHPEINALFFAAGGVYGGCRAVLSLHREKNIKIITFDGVDTTRDLITKDVISATICQQPKIQGSKPLDILFAYLTAGELPKKELNFVAVDIRIKENI